MSDMENIEAIPAAPEQDHVSNVPSHDSRRAAAVEAAYILEALRK
jgi:hypothetical protein